MDGVEATVPTMGMLVSVLFVFGHREEYTWWSVLYNPLTHPDFPLQSLNMAVNTSEHCHCD